MEEDSHVPHCVKCFFSVSLHVDSKCFYGPWHYEVAICPHCKKPFLYEDDFEKLGTDDLPIEKWYCITCEQLKRHAVKS